MAAESQQTGSSSAKRPRDMDEAEDLPELPRKKIFLGTKTIDLNFIFAVIENTQPRAATPLSTFTRDEYRLTISETQLPIFYSYQKLRAWLLLKGDIHLDQPITITLQSPSADGKSQDAATSRELVRFSVEDDAEFANPLALLQCGSVTGVPDGLLGHIMFIRAESNAAVEALDAAAVEALDAPPETDIPSALPGSQDNPVVLDDEEEEADDSTAKLALELMNQPPEPDDQPDHPPPLTPPAVTSTSTATSPNEQSASTLTDITDATWAEVCTFFQLKDPAAIQHRIPGMSYLPYDYQLAAVWRVLTNPIYEGVNGLMIGHDMGLGKTFTTLMLVRIRAKLVKRWMQVQDDWEDENLARHLPEDNPGGGVCPTQRFFPVQCPCITGSTSRQIVTSYLRDTPAMIIIPPGLCNSWLEQAKGVYLRPYNNFKTFVSSVQELSMGRKNTQELQRSIDETKGKATKASSQKTLAATETQVIAKGNGDSRTVIFISENSVRKFRELYVEQCGSQSVFVAGLVVLDEFHRYKGTGPNQTIVFREIQELQKHANCPVTMVPLCGTLLEEGPAAWSEAVAHFSAQWSSWSKGSSPMLKTRNDANPAFLSTGFPAVKKEFFTMLKAISSGKGTAETLQASKRRITAFLAPIAQCLRQSQQYRHRILNPLPHVHRTIQEVSSDLPQEVGDAFNSTMTSVNTLLEKKLAEQKRFWELQDPTTRGEEPTQQSILEDIYAAGSKNAGAFLTLQRSSMYPAIPWILEEPTINAEMLGSKCLVYASRCRSKIEQGIPIKQATKEVCRTWELFDYMKTLFRFSVKLRAIKDLITHICDQPIVGPPPRDGSGVQHAIIFLETPIAAVLTYFGLLRDPALQETTEILWLTSDIKPAERNRIVQAMNENLEPGARNKVLITTLSIGAEGFNLQRVNHVWFPEFPVTIARYYQAQCRAIRTGQRMEVNVHTLQDKGNWMESSGWNSLRALEQLIGMLYGMPEARR